MIEVWYVPDTNVILLYSPKSRKVLFFDKDKSLRYTVETKFLVKSVSYETLARVGAYSVGIF